MRGKSSKRKLKLKAQGSLASKQALPLDLLDEELRAQLESYGAGADIISVAGQPAAAASTVGEQAVGEEAAAGAKLSKAAKRKLKQVAAKKERRDVLAAALGTLQQHALDDRALGLLRPLSQRGARETKKQGLQRAMKLQRAGLEVPEELGLERRRKLPAGGDSGSDGDGDSDDSSMDDAGSDGVSSDIDGDDGGAGRSAAGRASNGAAEPPSSAHGGGNDGNDMAGAASSAPAGAAAWQPAAKRQKVAQEAEGAALDEAGRQQAAQAAMAAAKLEAARVRAALGVQPIVDEDAEAVRAAQRPSVAPAGPHRVVLVERPQALQEARLQLPILSLEQELLDAVSAHDVLVLCGETGCGKTTQVPQFLLEAGYGCRRFPERAGAIGVTQPRRVAAVSTAARVAEELGGELGARVGYQVRYDRQVGGDTAVKFMTDGILLRELQEDLLLQQYSVIVADEAHERSLNTDLLLGLLSRVVPLRRRMWADWQAGRSAQRCYPLKLIIMSATLRTEDFAANAKLFPTPPPVLKVPGRQFPITVHFARRTELHDYVSAAFKKVVRIHSELPPGGVLVFLTGQREVDHLVARLRKALGPKPASGRRRGGGAAPSAGGPAPAGTQHAGQADGGEAGGWGPEEERGAAAAAADAAEVAAADFDDFYGGDRAELSVRADEVVPGWGPGGSRGQEGAEEEEDDYDAMQVDSEEEGDEEEVVVMGGEDMTPEEIAAAERRFEEQFGFGAAVAPCGSSSAGGAGAGAEDGGRMPVHVLPLYAMLDQDRQGAVFQPPPAGHRLIVVATNVAETSLTIPGIRYVVDAGRSKQKLLEHQGGLARYEVRWVSKSSCEQRAGRAGRTGPGHCYRLFSSAHFNDTFPQHTPPEILNTALEGVILVMKSMGVERMRNFPFPTPPDAAALKAAEACLVALSALDPGTQALTELGRAMAAFPISPRHARMLLEVVQWQGRQEAGGGKAERARVRALPYALALAAALSVESPFVHVDTLGADDKRQGGQEQGQGEEDGEEEPGGAPRLSAAEAAERDAARLRMQQSGAAHARFRCADSDALSTLQALCAYESAPQPEQFCRQNYMHARHLHEMADLHRQLLRVLQRRLPQHLSNDAAAALAAEVQQAGGQLAAPLAPPPPAVQQLLRRAVAAGWADQAGHRVRSAQYIREVLNAPGKKKKHAVRYEAACLEEEVYLHPRSALHAAAPEFVVYTQLVRGAKRPYMAGVTAIEPQWLVESGTPLCSLSAPLSAPPAFYKPEADAVMCWRNVSFAGRLWPLPAHPSAHPDAAERAAVFAAALLDGTVVASLSALRPLLCSSPAAAAKPEMRAVARVGELLNALTSRQVFSRAALLDAWRRDPSFLALQLGMWVHKPALPQLQALWPRMVAEALGGGGGVGGAKAQPAAPAAGSSGKQASGSSSKRSKGIKL